MNPNQVFNLNEYESIGARIDGNQIFNPNKSEVGNIWINLD